MINLHHNNIWRGTVGKITTIAAVIVPFAIPYLTGQSDWKTISIGSIASLILALTGKKA